MIKHTKIVSEILAFRDARDWKKFHTPENLAKSISIEAGELLENFQWGDPADKAKLADELADVLIYSFLFAESIGIDPIEAIRMKIETNEKRFPVDTVKGTSGKYTRVD